MMEQPPAMPPRSATPPPGRGQAGGLSSELARACLPGAMRDGDRMFAWTAAVAALFLGVGIYGLFTRPVFAVPATLNVEEPIPVFFEPPPPPVANDPTPPAGADPEATAANPPPSAPVVAAVAAAADAVFAVPVEGPVILAPARLASAPPLDRRATHAPSTPTPLFTGDAQGKYPPPSYPREARQRGLQGKLLLLVVVGPDGMVSRAEVKETSGSDLLDRHAADWVRNRWLWPPGERRMFHVPVIFELK